MAERACKAGALPAELHAHSSSDLHSKAFPRAPKSIPSLSGHHCTKTPVNGDVCASPSVISLPRRFS